MSFENMLTCITIEAGSDLSAAQYRLVDVATDGQIDVVATKGAKMVGVLQDKPGAAGVAGCVAIGGVTKIVSGAAIAAGVEITSDANGAAIATDAINQYIVGTALEAAAAAGNNIAVAITKYQRSA